MSKPTEPSSPAPSPAFPDLPPDALCPSCGEFVGPARRCPHCGAVAKKRLSLVLARWLSVAVAILGLAALYGYARHRQIEVVRVGELTPTMNFAYVAVEGRVVHAPYVVDGPAGPERFNFEVDDGTGVIRVTGYRQTVHELLEDDGLPASGERVRVAGSVQYTGDQVRMILQVASHLERFPASTPEVRLSEVTEETIGQTVRTRGTVAEVRRPGAESRAPYRIEIEESGARLPVIFWSSVYEALAEPEKLTPGARVEVTAAVQSYRGTLQLQLDAARNLVIAGQGAPPAPTDQPRVEAPRVEAPGEAEIVEIGAIDAARIGSTVTVEGEVASVTAPAPGSRAPTRVEMVDGTGGSIQAVYWDDVGRELTAEARPREGVRWRATGRVDEYRGQLQFRVQSATKAGGAPAESASEAAAAAPGAASPSEVAIGTLSAEQVGARATVRGEVVSSREVNGGWLITIRDATGDEMTFPAWRSVVGDDPALPAAGTTVRVTGEIVEYHGRMEVVPDDAAGLAAVPGGE